MSLAAIVDALVEAGATPQMIAAAVRAAEAAGPTLTARQARNKRYYESKKAEASEERLNASEQDASDAKVSPPCLPPFSPPTPPPISPNQPTPSKINRQRPAGGEFDEFWVAYPRKVAKEAARKAFEKARRVADLPTILSGIENYRRDKPEYADWAHPASWLNAGRWGDDYSAPKPVGSPAAQAVPEFKTEEEFDAWWAARRASA